MWIEVYILFSFQDGQSTKAMRNALLIADDIRLHYLTRHSEINVI